MARDLTEVMAEHGGYVRPQEGVGYGWRCWCGADLRDWWPPGGVTPRDTALGVAFRAHLAAVIEAEVIRPREREAWRWGKSAAVNAHPSWWDTLPNPFAGEVE